MKCTAQDTSHWTTSCEQRPRSLPIACIIYIHHGSANPSQYWIVDPTVHTPVFTVATLKELCLTTPGFCLYHLYHACVQKHNMVAAVWKKKTYRSSTCFDSGYCTCLDTYSYETKSCPSRHCPWLTNLKILPSPSNFCSLATWLPEVDSLELNLLLLLTSIIRPSAIRGAAGNSSGKTIALFKTSPSVRRSFKCLYLG